MQNTRDRLSYILDTRLRSRRKARGQSLILVALMMFVLIGIVGLAVDGGSSYERRRTAQNAADGAAMAGARVMLHHYESMILANASDINGSQGVEDAITTAITDYLRDNGALTGAGDIEAYFVNESRQVVSVASGDNGCGYNAVPVDPCQIGENNAVPWDTGAKGVLVKGRAETDAFFMSLFGFNTVSAAASATAYMGVGIVTNLPMLPIGFYSASGLDGVNVGDIYTLIDKDLKISPGNFGWLAFNGDGSANTAEAWIQCGYNALNKTQADWNKWCQDQGVTSENGKNGMGPTRYWTSDPSSTTPDEPTGSPNSNAFFDFSMVPGTIPHSYTGDQLADASLRGGMWLPGSTGATLSVCSELEDRVADPTRPKIFAIPVIDYTVGTGSGSQFHLRDIGLFELTTATVACKPTTTCVDLNGDGDTADPGECTTKEQWTIKGKFISAYVSGSSGTFGELRNSSFHTVFLER